jgi:hypothetical protein
MVPTIMAVLPNKRTSIPTPWYRLLAQLAPLTAPVRQETEAGAAVERDVRPARARSPMTGDAVVIARIEAAALEEMLPVPA